MSRLLATILSIVIMGSSRDAHSFCPGYPWRDELACTPGDPVVRQSLLVRKGFKRACFPYHPVDPELVHCEHGDARTCVFILSPLECDEFDQPRECWNRPIHVRRGSLIWLSTSEGYQIQALRCRRRWPPWVLKRR
jgi:hypothetical protein